MRNKKGMREAASPMIPSGRVPLPAVTTDSRVTDDVIVGTRIMEYGTHKMPGRQSFVASALNLSSDMSVAPLCRTERAQQLIADAAAHPSRSKIFPSTVPRMYPPSSLVPTRSCVGLDAKSGALSRSTPLAQLFSVCCASTFCNAVATLTPDRTTEVERAASASAVSRHKEEAADSARTAVSVNAGDAVLERDSFDVERVGRSGRA